MGADAIGWAIVVGSLVLVGVVAAWIRTMGLVDYEAGPWTLLLVVICSAGSWVGFAAVYGSVGEGLGATVVALLLNVPYVYGLRHFGD